MIQIIADEITSFKNLIQVIHKSRKLDPECDPDLMIRDPINFRVETDHKKENDPDQWAIFQKNDSNHCGSNNLS